MDTEGKSNDGASLPSIARDIRHWGKTNWCSWTKHRAMWRQSGPYKRLVTERTRKGSSGHESQRRHARQDTQRRKWTHSCQGKRDVREDTQKRMGFSFLFCFFLLFLFLPIPLHFILLFLLIFSSSCFFCFLSLFPFLSSVSFFFLLLLLLHCFILLPLFFYLSFLYLYDRTEC